MNDRIKKLRKALDLTQQEFAQRIGMKQNSIALIESGKRNISNQAILGICREFHADEAWLRTGDGTMFIQRSREEEIAAFIGDSLSTGEDTFKKRFISMLSHLKESDWEVLERMAEKMKRG